MVIRQFTKKKVYIGQGPGCEPLPKPKTKIYLEFNSIHFVIEINKRLKFLTPIRFWI